MESHFNSSSCGQRMLIFSRDYTLLFPFLEISIYPLFIRGEPKEQFSKGITTVTFCPVNYNLHSTVTQSHLGRALWQTASIRRNRHDLGTFQTKLPAFHNCHHGRILSQRTVVSSYWIWVTIMTIYLNWGVKKQFPIQEYPTYQSIH